eukprot:5612597-Pleurochrysis_carterae.AAC.3
MDEMRIRENVHRVEGGGGEGRPGEAAALTCGLNVLVGHTDRQQSAHVGSRGGRAGIRRDTSDGVRACAVIEGVVRQPPR